MNQISPLQVKSAVLAFLSAQYEKKTESERKQLEKAKEAEDLVKISELETSLAAVRQKYSFEEWLQDAAERMAKQLKFRLMAFLPQSDGSPTHSFLIFQSR